MTTTDTKLTELRESISDFEHQAVPAEERRSWWFIAMIWVAIGIDVSGLFLGAFLSNGMPMGDALLSIFIGSSILAILAALCANVGFRSGLSTVLISSNVFGSMGGKLVGLVTGISLIGWYAFQLDFFTAVTTSALASLDIEISRFVVLTIGSVLMALTALWGVRALGKLSLVSVPILVTLIGYALYKVVIGGESIVDTVTDPIGFGTAISYVMSIWILGAVNSPDVARFAKRQKDALLGAGLGFLLGNSFIVVVALVLTKYVGNDDLVTVFFGLGMGLSAVLVLMLAQWTTNTMNLIGGALDLAVTFPKLRRTVLMLIIAVIGTLFAINGMIERFAVFLSFLGTVVAPIAGVYLVDFYLLNKGEPLSIERAQQAAYRPAAIVAWCVGALVCFMTSAEFLNLFSLTTISVLDGTLAAAVSYLGLSKLTLKAPVAEAAR